MSAPPASPAPRLVANPGAERRAYGDAERAVLSHAAGQAAREEIARWPGYAPTPLRALGGLAGRLGLGALWYKDEATRFGLGSFKALGGAYGVARALANRLSLRATRPVGPGELRERPWREQVRALTVACASEGNHGRAVAWGARTYGCGCVVFLPEKVSAARAAAIAAEGARVERVPGTFDDAARVASEVAREEGWLVVADTSATGGETIPRHVMQGYTVLAAEAVAQLGGAWPTHVFVQAGVGGLAAAVLAHLWEARGAERPVGVVVEPTGAACLLESARAGRPVVLAGELRTVMGCLACGEPSPLAWRLLERCADAFVAVPDAAAEGAMRRLAAGTGGDEPVVAGESGAAGLAGLLAVMDDADARQALALDASSRVLVIGSEGANDPAAWARIVGRMAQ